MNLLIYLVQVTVCLAFFYGFFLVALQKETHFSSNRFYLLVTLVISMLLPFVKIYVESQFANSLVTAPQQFMVTYLDSTNVSATKESGNTIFSWKHFPFALYLTGIAILLVRLLREVWHIYSIRRYGQRSTETGLDCILSTNVKSPFSFFHEVYLPADHCFNEEELTEVLRHEKAHINGLHSIDILLMEVIQIVLWPCPMIYLYRNKLREVHEFLADAEVLQDSEWEKYATFLVSQKVYGLQNSLSNHFAYSQLKKRLIMMTQRPSSKYAPLKFLGILPVMLLALIMFSFREKSRMQYEKSSLTTDTLPTTYITALKLSEPAPGTDMQKENKVVHDTYEMAMPVFPGCDDVPIRDRGDCGMTKLTDYINSHIFYPASMKEQGIEGQVLIGFKIGIDGYMTDIVVEKSLHPDADHQTLTMFERMAQQVGQWRPARKEGKTMEASLVIPITFSLSDANTSLEQQEVFQYVEEMPQFPGCERGPQCDKLYEYLGRSIKYPASEREKGIEGHVITRFTVNADGTISDIKVLRSVSPGLDEEAIRVVNEMNDLPEKWIPGRHNGKNVAVYFTLPFKFQLHENKKQNPEKSTLIETEKKEIPAPEIDKNISTQNAIIYPNLVDLNLNVEIFKGAHTLKIFDINGRQHITQKIPSGEFHYTYNINISSLPEGQYVLQVIADHKTEAMKFGIKR